MKKLIILLITSLCLSVVSFGQDTIIIRDGFIKGTTPKYILSVKDYQLIMDSTDIELLKVNSNWIKSISVFKDKAALELFQSENPVILIYLKRKSWKKLPEELRERFESNSMDLD